MGSIYSTYTENVLCSRRLEHRSIPVHCSIRIGLTRSKDIVIVIDSEATAPHIVTVSSNTWSHPCIVNGPSVMAELGLMK